MPNFQGRPRENRHGSAEQKFRIVDVQRYSLERRLGVHTLKICFFVTPGHVRGRVRWQRNNNQAAWFTSATDYYGSVNLVHFIKSATARFVIRAQYFIDSNHRRNSGYAGYVGIHP
jgi:hypothetical protein